jgi:uncharacterized membrane protein YebE (DUF533 family)
MMKQMLIAAFFLGLVNSAFAGLQIRKNSQSQRIEKGVQSGTITDHEAKKLNKGQEKIDRKSDRLEETKANAKADGYVDKSEKRKIISQKVNLRRTQVRQSEKIHNKNHNNSSKKTER